MHSYLTSVWLLTALGPDHMAVYVSPASDVDLLTSSLGPLLPIQDGGDRVVYFIYYSHGTDVGPLGNIAWASGESDNYSINHACD